MASSAAMDKFKSVSQDMLKAVGEKAVSSAGERVGGLTEKLEGVAEGNPVGKAVIQGAEAKAQGDSPVAGALKGAVSGVKDKVTGKKKGAGGSKRPTNITDTYEIGLPVTVVYNEWTNYERFPGYMKGPTAVSKSDPDGLESSWQAKIFLNKRGWKSKTVEQIPDKRIKWRTEGPKGSIDGVVTFHRIGTDGDATLMIFVLEYRPKGFFEWWGNRWRTVGRRYRLDVKHFRRDLMMRGEEADVDNALRSTIDDGEVIETNEDAVAREEEEAEQAAQDEQDEAGEDEAGEDEAGEESEEYEDEYEEEPAEYEDEEEPAEDEPEGEYEEEGAEEPAEDETAEEEPAEEPEDEYGDEAAEYDEDAEDGYEEEPAEDQAEEEPAEDEAEEEPAEEPAEDEVAEEEPAEDEEEAPEEEPEEEQPQKRPTRRRRSAS
jgi:uncharacterized membrane protein